MSTSSKSKGEYISLNRNYRGQFLSDTVGDNMFEQPLSQGNSHNIFKDRLAILEEESSSYTSPTRVLNSENGQSKYRNYNPMEDTSFKYTGTQ